MSAALDQLAVIGPIAAKRGMRIVGYHPKTGQPTHPDGSLILEFDMVPIGRRNSRNVEPAPALRKPPSESPKIVKRGVLAGVKQPTLL